MPTINEINTRIATALGLPLDGLADLTVSVRAGKFPVVMATYHVVDVERLATELQRYELTPKPPVAITGAA